MNVIHPRAVISPAPPAEGAQVLAGAVINPGVTIGENCLINTGAVIDHDCAIGRTATSHRAPCSRERFASARDHTSNGRDGRSGDRNRMPRPDRAGSVVVSTFRRLQGFRQSGKTAGSFRENGHAKESTCRRSESYALDIKGPTLSRESTGGSARAGQTERFARFYYENGATS